MIYNACVIDHPLELYQTTLAGLDANPKRATAEAVVENPLASIFYLTE